MGCCAVMCSSNSAPHLFQELQALVIFGKAQSVHFALLDDVVRVRLAEPGTFKQRCHLNNEWGMNASGGGNSVCCECVLMCGCTGGRWRRGGGDSGLALFLNPGKNMTNMIR